MNMKKLNAFTLLEVLLVVLLALLLFMYKTQIDSLNFEKEGFKEGARTVYSSLNKATVRVLNRGGFAQKFKNEKDMVEFLGRELNAIKYCDSAQHDNCWSKTWLWGDNLKPGLQLYTGQYLTADFVSADCTYNKNIPNTCGFVYVDTNGYDSPNEIGKDIIMFYMTRQGFIPAGTQFDVMTKREDCNMKKGSYSWGCTAQLLGLK